MDKQIQKHAEALADNTVSLIRSVLVKEHIGFIEGALANSNLYKQHRNELLAALKLAHQHLLLWHSSYQGNNVYEAVSAAIDKAEGQS